MFKKIYFSLPVSLVLSFAAFCQSSPLTEGFNTVTPSALPGWSFINKSLPSNTVSNWQQGNTSLFSAQSGPANSYIQSYGNINSSAAAVSNWLLTPQRTLHNGDVITFYTRTQSALSAEALEVRLTTNGNSSNVGIDASSTGDFTTLLLTVNPSKLAAGYPSQWTKYTITISGLSGTPQGRIAFRHLNGVYPGYNYTVAAAIDNFTYTAYPVATRLYVDSSTAESSNGLSWSAPFKTLSEAFNIANTYNNITEIWVKKGTYYPDEGPGRTNNDHNSSFSLKNGLAIYGGFAGGEVNLNQRNWRTNPTVLSGEIDQVAGTGGNAYHVVHNESLNNTAVLDGFTITGGNANGGGVTDGGGMYNNNSSPSLVNCTFSQNTAIYGGAMYNTNSSPSSLVNCSFSQNMATYGGVMYNNYNSSPRLVNCSFTQNKATDIGGGMFNAYSSSPSLVNCSFSQNTATTRGGGVYNYSSSPSLTNCVLWGNTNGQIINFEGSAPTVSNSIVQGGYGGSNNLDADPLFVNVANPAGPDGIFGTSDDGLQLQCGSPAINTGNNDVIPANDTTDITGNSRIRFGRVDMGAYESPYTNVADSFLYVDSSRAISGDGTSWETALKTVREALFMANNCFNGEIWVKKGTYYPTTDGNRDSSFRIVRNGTKIYGGFAGEETTLAARNVKANPTILSGNIGTADSDNDNSYHVVTIVAAPGSVIDNNTIIDGFTIQKGSNAGGTDGTISIVGQAISRFRGAGILIHGAGNNNSCSPVIRNCFFTANASARGGALYNNGSSQGSSNPVVSHCIFSENSIAGEPLTGGGVVYNDGSMGGASSPAFINSVFNKNTGNSVYNYGRSGTSSPVLTNCTFNNYNGTHVGGTNFENGTSIPVITNCIFWQSSNIVAGLQSTALVTFSFIRENSPLAGAGNISGLSTIFIDEQLPPGNDGIFGTPDDGLRVAPCATTVNTGSNAASAGIATDVTGNNRVLHTTVDMGAYEALRLPPSGNVLYVDSSITSLGNGSSWSTAYKTLEEALAAANVCSGISEVWVKKGTYYPTVTANRDVSFVLSRDGVKIYGGFAGGETTLQRKISANPTILSGDIGLPGNDADNSYHVALVFNNNVTIDGFTIQKGNANSFSDIYYKGQQTKRHCGGGIYSYYFQSANSPVISNCTFIGNNALTRGGAVYNIGLQGTGNPVISNCFFSGNKSSFGSAIYNDIGTDTPIITNCVFYKNEGAAINNNGSSTYITNCTFTAQNASIGGCIRNEGGSSRPQIANCIFRFNSSIYPIYDENGASSKTTYSILQNATSEPTNINADPLFVNAANPAGDDGFFGTADDGLRLLTGSPAINKGNNDSIPTGVMTDITGALRIQNGTVDMGAYEGAVTPAIYSITSGPWNNAATWSCNCVPQGNNIVTIKAGHTITITAAMGNLQCGKLTLEAASVFNVTGGLFKVVGSE